MIFTGERLHPEINGQIAIEHLHRYALASDFVKGKKILDVASGEGYGSYILSKYATSVVGVDISQDAVKHASDKYKNNNLSYVLGSADALPLNANEFDVVVSFETIEHLIDHQAMLSEIKRVLKPGGILIISSPDKEKYTDDTNHENEYHLKELYFDEFKKLIKDNFKNSFFYLQSFSIGSFIYKEEANKGLSCFTGDFNEINKFPLPSHLYNLAIASDSDLNDMEISFFEGKDLYFKIEDFYREKMKSIYDSKSYRFGNFFVSIYNKLFK